MKDDKDKYFTYSFGFRRYRVLKEKQNEAQAPLENKYVQILTLFRLEDN